MGAAEFDLSSLTSARPSVWSTATVKLDGPKAQGSITISARPYAQPSVTVLRAQNLRNADFSKKNDVSDPYVRLSGLTDVKQKWGETRTTMDNLNPIWNETFEIPITVLLLNWCGALSKFSLGVWDEDNHDNWDESSE